MSITLILTACDSFSQSTNCINADVNNSNEMTQDCIVDTFNWDDLERNTVMSSLEKSSEFVSNNAWTDIVREDMPFALSLGNDNAVLLTKNNSQLHLIDIQNSVLSETSEKLIHSVNIDTNIERQLLQGIDMTADASMIIASVLTDRNNKVGDKGTGLYIAQVNNENSTSSDIHSNADTNVTSTNVNNNMSHTDYKSDFYQFPNILSFAINPINNNIAVADVKGNIHILSPDLQKLAETRVYFHVYDLAFSHDGNNLFVAGKKMLGIMTSQGIISHLNINEQKGNMFDEIWQWKTRDSITEIVVFDDRRVLAKPKTQPELYIVGANNKGNKGIHKTIELNFTPTNIAVNTLTNTIAVSDKNHVETINIENNERSEATTDDSIADIAFFKNTKNDNGTQDTHLFVATEKELLNYKLP